jgi:phytoene dehydrogenase-like protein
VRDRVLARLRRALGRDVGRDIEVEERLTPAEIQRNTGSTHGSLYGIASNTPLAAFLRHPNRVRRYPGLYLCGGSVHPGGGMPLAVLSGKITADLVRRDHPVGR